MHSNKRQSWYKEGALTTLTGVLYGMSNTIVGHPFDTIKTKMQAQASHMAGESSKGPRYTDCIKKTYYEEGGLRAFYRGWLPPMWGSIMYRSLQFAVFEMVFTACDDRENFKKEIPMSGGI